MIRNIHLGFHTHDFIPAVGRGFDPEAFADTLAKAHVNWHATPGKGDMGSTCSASSVCRPHPHLVCPDLFPATGADLQRLREWMI